MFTKARIKLTLWYLVILMFVSAVFSIVMYNMASIELMRGFRIQELRVIPRFRQATESSRIEEQEIPESILLLRNAPLFNLRMLFAPDSLHPVDLELLTDARQRIAFQLLSLNAVILVLSGLFSFFLSGRTLRPIQSAMEEQKRFVADASHELKTPLTVMRTEIEVMLRNKHKSTPQEYTALLQSNLDEVIRMQKLSEYLLNLHSLQKHVVSYTQQVDVLPLIEKTATSMKKLAAKKHINIAVDAKPAFIFGDELSLTELLTILVENAVKYGKENGNIVLSTKSKRHTIQIRVEDDGIGISKEHIPHIFDRFYRTDESRTRSSGGYGLGLSIAQIIVHNHRGHISVKSVPNKGTIFSIDLPKAS